MIRIESPPASRSAAKNISPHQTGPSKVCQRSNLTFESRETDMHGASLSLRYLLALLTLLMQGISVQPFQTPWFEVVLTGRDVRAAKPASKNTEPVCLLQ